MGEKELYCFDNPSRFDSWSSDNPLSLVANDGEHSGFDYGRMSLFEGFGLIPGISDDGQPEIRIGGDLFGETAMLSGSQRYVPYLCYIKDGDGNILLGIDGNVTGKFGNYGKLDSVTAGNSSEILVRVAGGRIEVTCGEALGSVVLMNAQGAVVYGEYVGDNEVSIPVEGMPRGVYLVKVGDSVRKVAI